MDPVKLGVFPLPFELDQDTRKKGLQTMMILTALKPADCKISVHRSDIGRSGTSS